jgi:GNAT superfamily N-acetyltransferase
MEIISITPAQLGTYASIPISFEVRSIFEIQLPQGGLGGIQLYEQPVDRYIKNYDALDGPLTWPRDFDLANWSLFLAVEGETPLGGAAVAWNTNGVNMLEGRRDMSVLWDIRVQPAWRGKGLGKTLFAHAARWSKKRGCQMMKIETQNINVAACRFYAAQGCQLGDIRRFAYLDTPSVAHEVQLNWYLSL